MYSQSQNSPPEGKGFHFMFKVVSRLLFPEESDGADHFLKKGAKHAHFSPLFAHEWAKLKTLLFDISNIFLINNQQLLCFWISLIH